MGFKGVFVVLVVILIIFGFLYNNLPGEVIELEVNIPPRIISNSSYANVPVFSDNLRFNHNEISYYISDECDHAQKFSMISAFNIFANETEIISFYEVGNVAGADIEVKCSDDRVDLGGSMFAAGEGGPSEIVNTSYFKTIRKGSILLYKKIDCTYPIVELHELCHVFGFDHSDDPVNIMYNTSACSQRISTDMIDFIQELYSIEPLPDLVIDELSVTEKGKYFDFNISVLNEGLIMAKDVSLVILADGKLVDEIDLENIDYGYGRTLGAENFRLPSRNVDVIEFFVDRDNEIRELNEENNYVKSVVEG